MLHERRGEERRGEERRGDERSGLQFAGSGMRSMLIEPVRKEWS